MQFQLLLKDANTQITIRETRIFTDRAQCYECAETFTINNKFLYVDDDVIFSQSPDKKFQLHIITL